MKEQAANQKRPIGDRSTLFTVICCDRRQTLEPCRRSLFVPGLWTLLDAQIVWDVWHAHGLDYEGASVVDVLTSDSPESSFNAGGAGISEQLFPNRLSLGEEQQVIRAAGLGIGAAHIEPTKWMNPHQRAGALAVEV